VNGSLDPFASAFTNLLVDDSAIYWSTRNGSLLVLPKTKPAAQAFVLAEPATPADAVLDFTVDTDSVYFTTRGTPVMGPPVSSVGRVAKVPKTGGASVTLAMGQLGMGGLSVDDRNVYFFDEGVNGGAVRSVPKAGGAIVTVAQSQRLGGGIMATGGFVYWTAASTTGNGTVTSAAVDGTQLVTLASGLHASSSIVVDAASVYVAQLADPYYGMLPVERIARAGGQVTDLAVGMAGVNTNTGIAVDGTSVFWTTADGTLFGAAK
jgi:hypothetical protein